MWPLTLLPVDCPNANPLERRPLVQILRFIPTQPLPSDKSDFFEFQMFLQNADPPDQSSKRNVSSGIRIFNEKMSELWICWIFP